MRIQTPEMLLPQQPVLKTGRLERARDHLSSLFWPHDLRPAHRRHALAFRHNKLNLSSLSINALQYGEEVKIDASPTTDAYLVKCTLAGHTVLEQSGHTIRSRPGSVCVMNPSDHVNVHLSRDHNQLTLRVDGKQLQRFLEQELDRQLHAPLQFLPFAMKLGDGENSLGRLMLPLCRALGTQPEFAESERLLKHLEEVLLAALLAELPHSYSSLYLERSIAAVPGNIARVQEYIQANFRDSLGLRELAIVAGTSVRSLQMAFQKELGITPGTYIRNTRLDHAHRLLTQQSSRHAVTDAALASGFTHLGKFSCYYRQRFRQLPSASAKQAAALSGGI